MKKTMLSILTLIILFSCKDKKDDKVCTTSVESISGSYKITSMSYKENVSAVATEVFSTWVEECDRDNVLTFNTNGSYHTADAGTTCSPSSDDDGTWSLSGNTMVTDGDPAIIESYDCKTLVLSQTDIEIPGDKLKLTLTKQ